MESIHIFAVIMPFLVADGLFAASAAVNSSMSSAPSVLSVFTDVGTSLLPGMYGCF